MRFRFCGDLDAPNWLLTEMAVLSKISSVRMKILSKQVVLQQLGEPIDYDKVLKMTKDTFSNISDVKAAIAGLDFIIANSAKYDIDENTLSLEIQQLGLPTENCDALLKSYKDGKEKLRSHLGGSILQLQRLKSLDWRVDSLISSSTIEEIDMPSVQLKFGVAPPPRGSGLSSNKADSNQQLVEASFEVPAEKFNVLFSELKIAHAMMETLE